MPIRPFQIGDRVKRSEYDLRGLIQGSVQYMSWSPQGARARQWLVDARAERGTVIPTCPEWHHNGPAGGVSVVMDKGGGIHHSVDYLWVMVHEHLAPGYTDSLNGPWRCLECHEWVGKEER